MRGTPTPQIPTTGRPFCRAYALEEVWVDLTFVQSVLISDCRFVQR
jgi:hypothetical protein